MWMNWASGNSSSSVGIRQVCVGDFSTSRRGSRKVSRRRKPTNASFHARRARRGKRSEVERFLILRRVVGKGDGQVGRRLAEHAQRELVFLRAIPVGRHVVHRPTRGKHPAKEAFDDLLGEQEVIRLQAVVVVGPGMARVEDEHLVQQRGPGAPVADDEQRRLADDRAVELAAVPRLLQVAQHRVAGADAGDDEGHVQELGMDGEVIAPQQAHPGEQVAALPHSWRPFAPGRLGRSGQRVEESYRRASRRRERRNHCRRRDEVGQGWRIRGPERRYPLH